jgi:rhamnosyl/mannosyltransferase
MFGKSAVIPYPFTQSDASNLAQLTESEKNKFADRFIILAVGRLIYYKGFKFLVEAARYLPPEYLVLIVGTGPLRSELQAQIDLEGLSDRVMLCGKMPASNLLTYFSVCDVFCLPSTERGEMFGMVQLEAMDFGKPVVGTRIPNSGVCEVNLDNLTGINVPVKDSVAIANAVIKLANNPDLLSAMGCAGRQRVELVYDKSVVIPQFIKIFKECMDSR